MAKYKRYVQGKYGEWYGVDKYGGKFRVYDYDPQKGSSARGYRVGVGHGGNVNISNRYKNFFPKDVTQGKSRGGYRISDKYISEYKGKAFGKRNPFSPLNIKINGAQKAFTASSNKKFPKGSTFAWLRQHLVNVVEKIEIGSMNYTIILSLRAQKIFQNSFKYKKFYSADGDSWQPLAKSTIKKRERKGTWPGDGGMLREYGDMFRSIKTLKGSITRNGVKFNGSFVNTDPKEYVQHSYTNRHGQSITDKRGVFCYAGLHNEGGKIRGGRKLPKRQFIGHSTYLYEFALAQADRYFFFNVFD